MIIWLYWAQYLLTLLNSFFHLPQHSASPPSLLSFLFSVFSFLNFLLFNLLPKNKWICRYATGWTSHHLINDFLVSSALPWWKVGSHSLLYKPGCALSTQQPQARRALSLTRGLTRNLLKCALHTWDKPMKYFFKVHLPYPKKPIACAISEKSWS